MIVIKDLTKKFGNTVAIDHVSIQIPEGSLLILGSNGSGKSTLLKILAGIYRPTSGSVLVFGRDPWRDENVKLRFGVSFDPPSLPSLITGREWLYFIASAKGSGKKDVERVSKMFELDYLDEKIQGYSAGMIKRLAIAQAFIGSPELVILDEPLANLDFHQIEMVIRALKNLKIKSGISFIIVSHIWEPLYTLVDNVMVMSAGKVVLKGDARELEAKVNDLFSFRTV
ncbi:ABC transporter ATP-binding protein [Thermococcus sp.]